MEPPGRTAHIIRKDFYFERASAISSIWEEEDSFNALRMVAVPSHSISLLFSIIEVMTFAAIGPQEPFSMMATFLFWKFLSVRCSTYSLMNGKISPLYVVVANTVLLVLKADATA